MTKIEALNSLQVSDWSCSCGELEYVIADIDQDDCRKLYDAGFTEEQVLEALGDDASEMIIDLSILAFNYADAKWWSKDTGFAENEPEEKG